MRESTIRKYLEVFRVAKYLTRDNLSIITDRGATDSRNLRKEPVRVLHELKKLGYVSIIPKRYFIEPKQGKRPRLPDLYEVFWQLTEAGCQRLGIDHKYIQHKYPKDLEHEIMKIDVIMSFIKNYSQDFDIQVDYEKNLNGYKPDAWIRMINYDTGARYDFLLEIETGTRHVGEQVDHKFKPLNNFDPKKNKLNNETKVLVVQSHGSFIPSIRPVDYKNFKDRILMIERRTTGLMDAVRKSGKVKQPFRFLFLPYNQFPRLNESVWTDLRGERRKLV